MVQESLGTHSFGIYISSTISGPFEPRGDDRPSHDKANAVEKSPTSSPGSPVHSAPRARVFAVYYPKWIMVDSKFDHTANVLCTLPAVPGFLAGFFFDQVNRHTPYRAEGTEC